MHISLLCYKEFVVVKLYKRYIKICEIHNIIKKLMKTSSIVNNY